VAGIMVFNSGDWHVSSGGFRELTEGVCRHLASSQAATAVKGAFALASESQLYFIDVTDSFIDEMFVEFKRALDSYICEVTAVDLRPEDDLELHKGYLSRLKALQEKVNESLTR
jgi:hypothetical protein